MSRLGTASGSLATRTRCTATAVANTQQQINLAGSTAVASDYFHYAIHCVLYQREIYDQAVFKMVKTFGLQMMIVEVEAIAEALRKIVDQVWGRIDCNRKKDKMDRKTKRVQKVKGTLKSKAKESGDGWQSDEEDCAAKRIHWEEMNSKSQDLDKPESLAKEAGRLEQERHRHAKERDEFVARLKAKACKTDEAHERTSSAVILLVLTEDDVLPVSITTSPAQTIHHVPKGCFHLNLWMRVLSSHPSINKLSKRESLMMNNPERRDHQTDEQVNSIYHSSSPSDNLKVDCDHDFLSSKSILPALKPIPSLFLDTSQQKHHQVDRVWFDLANQLDCSNESLDDQVAQSIQKSDNLCWDTFDHPICSHPFNPSLTYQTPYPIEESLPV
ncbi:hypothetical protein O181_084601 [Austropuccinia psidii MF-1]|uniref:Uncharacterized protein n=1 Tax=Austropuccinia psidii MF-1 TaxID=1389203 RepID=A0A9Q3IIY8_9BASI|nr:hypothetical protein [Austropuccinia psidii MF-1]